MFQRSIANLFITLSLIFVLDTIANGVYAQSAIRLKDVSKVLLLTRGPVISGGGRNTEVLREKNTWNCYQTLIVGEFGKNRDSARKLVKAVNANDLRKLVKIINKADTGLRIKNFNIDKKLLVKYIDSISFNSKLPDSERPAFEKFLRSDDSLQKALYQCIRELGHSDFSYKLIYIITKANDTIKVSGNSSKVYNMPWNVAGNLNYDPAIDALFNKIINVNTGVSIWNKYFYAALCKCAYMQCFHKNRSIRFFWYEAPKIRGEFKEVKN